MKRCARQAVAKARSHKGGVGLALSALRGKRELTIRELAEKSGLAVNTLSLIENDRCSPSVATQQLATTHKVPITSFFVNGVPKSRLAYFKACERVVAAFAHGTLDDLDTGMPDHRVERFVVTMKPNANSGSHPIVHTGYEFVFCLEGRIIYTVEDQTNLLDPEDSLLFEFDLPHRWQNVEAIQVRTVLVLCPNDLRDQAAQRHFFPSHFQSVEWREPKSAPISISS